MTFEEWLASLGCDRAALNPTQLVNLALLYDGEQRPSFADWLAKLGFTGELEPTQRANLEQMYRDRYPATPAPYPAA